MNTHPSVELPVAQWDALRAAYATPPRAYHNFAHVQEVLRHYDDVAAGPGWRQPREVYLAVLYHDAIYEAGRRDNETRSAALAREALLARAPLLFSWTQAMLAVDDLDQRVAATPVQRTVRDALDACVALDVDLEPLLPAAVLRWHRALA